MTHIQNGKIIIDSRDPVMYNLKAGYLDPKTYPELVQFCFDNRHFIIAVAVDGTVWNIMPDTATQIIGLKDIVSVGSGILLGQLMLVTKKGNLIDVIVEQNLNLRDMRTYKFSSPVICAEGDYLICSNGWVYKSDPNIRKYERIIPELHIVQMDIRKMTFLANDNIVYNDEGEIVFDLKPVVKIYHGLTLAENGEVYRITVNNAELLGSVPNPEDVMQIFCMWKEIYVVYRNKTLYRYNCDDDTSSLTLINSIPDIDCFDGPIMIQTRPKSASLRPK